MPYVLPVLLLRVMKSGWLRQTLTETAAAQSVEELALMDALKNLVR